ncbi:Ig-like domain-containing protein, partial [Enterococcus faecalis]|uniref:Ig-like domain-containing protein n=1 Tax=Enterococcus faecalis TaxID=1351 RepID=UPI003984ADF9
MITGTGIPGDKIELTDKDGNKIGEGTVGGDGKYEISPNRPVKEGETLTATPNTDGQKGTPESTVVGKKPYDGNAHKPTINPSKEGDKVITGTGIPGDKIELTDKDGNKIGEGTVGGDGKYEISPNRPVKEGETLTATPNTDGQKGTPESTVVGKKPYDGNAHKPTINPSKEGDKVITGTGIPGDKIEL